MIEILLQQKKRNWMFEILLQREREIRCLKFTSESAEKDKRRHISFYCFDSLCTY